MSKLLTLFLGAAAALGAVVIDPGWAAAAEPARRVVAMLPLHAASEDPVVRQLAASLSDVIGNSLSEDRGISVVERAKLDQVLAEQKLQTLGLVDPATASQLGKLLGAELVFGGSLVDDGGTLRLAINVVATSSSEVRGALDLPLARGRVAEDVLAAAPRIAKLADVAVAAPPPESLDDSPFGRLHLLRGLSCYAAKQSDQAIVHLLQAVRVDPRLIEARIWIARAYLDVGQPDKARVELAWLRNHPRARDREAELKSLEAEIARSEPNPSQGGK